MIDRIVDPLVAFQAAHPEFRALWAGSDVSPRLAAVMEEFHEAVVERAESILAARATHMSPGRIKCYALVGVQLVKALLPLVAAARPAERTPLVRELKAVQRAYLAPDFGTKAVTVARRVRAAGRRSPSRSRRG
jgi:Tetracyclin repressor-like, C-terminal domain